MPEKFISTFVQVFSRLPQKVIWKWDDPNRKPDNVSQNVLLAQWLPQQDLLGESYLYNNKLSKFLQCLIIYTGHPDVKLFITHGGLLGMQECFYHAVPLLVLPFGTDQPYNAAKAKHEGCALKLDWNDLDEKSLYESITTIISQPRYIRYILNVRVDHFDIPLLQIVSKEMHRDFPD